MLTISQVRKPLSEAVIFKLEPPKVLVKTQRDSPSEAQVR